MRNGRKALVNSILKYAAIIGIFLTASVSAQELSPLGGQSESQTETKEQATSKPAIETRLQKLQEELLAIEHGLYDSAPVTAEQGQKLAEKLRTIKSLLEQQVSALQAATATLDENETNEVTLDPSVFSLYALYEKLQAHESSPDPLTERREALAQAKEKFSEAERVRRQVRSEWEQAEAAEKSRIKNGLNLRRLESRIAEETMHLRQLQLRNFERGGAAGSGADSLNEQIEALRQRLAKGEGEASVEFAELVQQEEQIRREREAAKRDLATTELRLSAVQKRYSAQQEPSAMLLAEVEAWNLRRDALTDEISLLEQRLERLSSQRNVWQHWNEILRKETSREQAETWAGETDQRIAQVKQAILQLTARASDVEERIAALNSQVTEQVKDSRLIPVLSQKLKALERLHQTLREQLRVLAQDKQLSETVLRDIHSITGHFNILEYLAAGASTIRDVWNYELTSVDDSPITIGSFVLAVLLFCFGLWVSRRGAAAVRRVAESRFKLDVGASHALQNMAFYALLVSFTLLALQAIHFPLTAFTVLGGALAIGVGFGSQNVMNNFISGLILMLERPVRARDVVEVDGNHGTIEKIGARSTQIRSTDGRHIVVPNSFFLESNVVNWTLSDDLIRAKVSVGVMYGSPTRLVEELIQKAVAEDSTILRDPEPIVIFEEFADNSLNFDVYFWINARSPMGVKKIQSTVRFRIDDLFREHDLVIAFPQRDVHLDTVSPVEVRIIGDK